MVESTREQASNKKPQKYAPKLQPWGWLSLKEMFSDWGIPYGGIYPGTGFQQEGPKVGPKACQHWGWLSLNSMFNDRDISCGVICPGTGFQQEAPKVGPKALTLGLVVFQRNVQ